MSKVERSAGIPITIGGRMTPYRAGGGYEGKTPELDAVVAKAAKMLSGAFKRDVEIRFNSDRESGGAWFKNSLEGFKGNCQIGLCAGIYKVCPPDWTRDEMVDAALDHSWPWSERKLRYECLPTEIRVSTNVKEDALLDKSLATSGTPESHYCWLDHESLEGAIRWLKNNVDFSAILD